MANMMQSMELLFLRVLPLHLGIILVFSLVERFVPAGPLKPIRGWLLNLKIMILYKSTPILFSIVVSASVAFASGIVGLGLIDLRAIASNSMAKLALATLLTMFVGDFFYYWFHRFQHENSFLWQQHKLHHMDEQMSAITSGRHHWLEDLLRVPTVTIPMAILFKLTPPEGGIIGLVIGAWPVFFHSNLRVHLGPASVLFNGPQVHRIHHSRLREHHNQNYAGFFPVWDLLFGTYHHPAPGEFPPTGVDDETEVKTAFEAALLPFREWWTTLENLRASKVTGAE